MPHLQAFPDGATCPYFLVALKLVAVHYDFFPRKMSSLDYFGISTNE